MEGTVAHFLPLLALSFLVAFVYASVGHGGASGYLALLSLFSFPHEQMAASALFLNLFVAGIAFWIFRKASHFSWRLTWPFTLTSIPAAFLGGLIKISPSSYSFLLGGVLLLAGFRLLIDTRSDKERAHSSPPLLISLPVGAVIGILSGIVGIGGGIFLSPIIILTHWAAPKETAATSAFFIFTNSLAGLLARYVRNAVQLPPVLSFLILASLCGGILGARMGAGVFSGRLLKRILAGVLLLATLKLLYFIH